MASFGKVLIILPQSKRFGVLAAARFVRKRLIERFFALLSFTRVSCGLQIAFPESLGQRKCNIFFFARHGAHGVCAEMFAKPLDDALY